MSSTYSNVLSVTAFFRFFGDFDLLDLVDFVIFSGSGLSASISSSSIT